LGRIGSAFININIKGDDMKDKLLFDILDEAIGVAKDDIARLEAERNRQNVEAHSTASDLFIRRLYKLNGKAEALEDLRTELVSKGFFNDDTESKDDE
jgi:uncharacterized small protein (DUF1192 family)